MTDKERSEAGGRANRARNRNLSPERRSELAGIAGRQRWKNHTKVEKKRPPRLDPEVAIARKSEGGKKGQAKRMQTTTPEQRREWSRLAGIKSAAKRWGTPA
jgi:type IV secretory pathway VirD2 relaxase